MQTLANILAGVPGDPSQVSPGLSPLLMQQLIAQQGQQQPGIYPGANMMGQPQPGTTPQQGQPGGGIGSLGLMSALGLY